MTFSPDRGTYIRTNAWLAAVAMAGAMIVLWLIGNPYPWTGAPAGLAAVGIRAWYMASEELVATWTMTASQILNLDEAITKN